MIVSLSELKVGQIARIVEHKENRYLGYFKGNMCFGVENLGMKCATCIIIFKDHFHWVYSSINADIEIFPANTSIPIVVEKNSIGELFLKRTNSESYPFAFADFHIKCSVVYRGEPHIMFLRSFC